MNREGHEQCRRTCSHIPLVVVSPIFSDYEAAKEEIAIESNQWLERRHYCSFGTIHVASC